MQKTDFYPIWISLILVLVFTLQSFFPPITEALLLTNSSLTEPWRFVTAIFLHGSFSHLLFNLFALVIFGLILEKIIGSKKFLLIFLTSGILANIFASFFYPSSLGASGAIMGVIGALAIIRPLMNVWAFGMIMPMFIAAILWVIGDSLGIFIPSNIGHIAHLSGIVVGIVFGIILRANHQQAKKKHMIEVPEHILRRWETLYLR